MKLSETLVDGTHSSIRIALDTAWEVVQDIKWEHRLSAEHEALKEFYEVWTRLLRASEDFRGAYRKVIKLHNSTVSSKNQEKQEK